MSQFCSLCIKGDKFIAKTCPRVNCEHNKGHNNDKEDRSKKDEQTKHSI